MCLALLLHVLMNRIVFDFDCPTCGSTVLDATSRSKRRRFNPGRPLLFLVHPFCISSHRILALSSRLLGRCCGGARTFCAPLESQTIPDGRTQSFLPRTVVGVLSYDPQHERRPFRRCSPNHFPLAAARSSVRRRCRERRGGHAACGARLRQAASRSRRSLCRLAATPSGSHEGAERRRCGSFGASLDSSRCRHPRAC